MTRIKKIAFWIINKIVEDIRIFPCKNRSFDNNGSLEIAFMDLKSAYKILAINGIPVEQQLSNVTPF